MGRAATRMLFPTSSSSVIASHVRILHALYTVLILQQAYHYRRRKKAIAVTRSACTVVDVSADGMTWVGISLVMDQLRDGDPS